MHWIRITNKPSETVETTGSTETRTQASPYDLPVGFRFWLSRPDVIRIEFRYLDIEDKVTTFQANQTVRIELGQDSGRIIAIEVAWDTKNASSALRSDWVRSAFRRLKTTKTEDNLKENYDIAQKVLESHSDSIAQQLRAAS